MGNGIGIRSTCGEGREKKKTGNECRYDFGSPEAPPIHAIGKPPNRAPGSQPIEIWGSSLPGLLALLVLHKERTSSTRYLLPRKEVPPDPQQNQPDCIVRRNRTHD
jgi:hypothetical protein